LEDQRERETINILAMRLRVLLKLYCLLLAIMGLAIARVSS
jgi:hypothetical protein